MILSYGEKWPKTPEQRFPRALKLTQSPRDQIRSSSSQAKLFGATSQGFTVTSS